MHKKTVIPYIPDFLLSKYERKISKLKTSICLIDFPFRGQGLIFLDQYMSESDSGLQPGLDIRKWSGRYLHSPHPCHHHHSLSNGHQWWLVFNDNMMVIIIVTITIAMMSRNLEFGDCPDRDLHLQALTRGFVTTTGWIQMEIRPLSSVLESSLLASSSPYHCDHPL